MLNGLSNRSHRASLGVRIRRAAGAALLGLVVATLVPLFLFGFGRGAELLDNALGRDGISESKQLEALQSLFCVGAGCAAAVVLRELLIRLRGGQDNDKSKFFKRAATALVVVVPLAGLVLAVRTAQDYRSAGFVYLTVLPCAIAGALANGLLGLLDARRDQPAGAGGTAAGGGLGGYARRAGLMLGLASVIVLVYVSLQPAGFRMVRGLLHNEPFAEGMPVGYWQDRLNDKDENRRKRAAEVLGTVSVENDRKERFLHPPRPVDAPRDKRIVAALAGKEPERQAEALFDLTRHPDFLLRGDAIEELASTHPPRVDLLTEVLKSDDLFTRNQAVIALGQLGPEAKPAVPALLELWWDSSRTFGQEIGDYAGVIEAIEPGALKRSRIGHYLARSAIAGVVLALPIFGVLCWFSAAARSAAECRARRARALAQPNPFDDSGVPSSNGEEAGADTGDPAEGADEKPALGGRFTP